mgnify:CR=1 FL=1
MALVLQDRVRETSTSTGTGAITLAGAVTGFQSFSVIGSNNTTYYTITMGADWEVGIGTYTTPTPLRVLSRDTVLESSNSGLLVNFGAGTKDVFVTFPAEGFASPPAIGGTTPNTITGTTVTANTYIQLPAITSGNIGYGIIKMIDGGDGYDYLNIYTDDFGGYQYGVNFPLGISTPTISGLNLLTSTGANFTGDGSTYTGYIKLYGYTGSATIQANTSGTYTLTLPNSAGSNNQVLKTDGSGNLSWLDFGSPPAIGSTTANTGAFTTLSASNTVSGTGFSNYLASPPAIGGTAAAAGTFTTLSATSVAATSCQAVSGGKTSVTTITNQATPTTGGVTLASQTAAAGATWRIRAYGTFTNANSATARTARITPYWNTTALPALAPSVLVSVAAATTQWQCEFTLTASSTTAIWTTGQIIHRISSNTAGQLFNDTLTAASTTVTAGAQTIDLRFSVSTAVAAESWNVQSVIIERLV